ncbi:MAG: hypothetical protein LC808_35715, partial [Actinobacteria bacterium]|nr:hypothetical protein [Actinomycetota bacterium]
QHARLLSLGALLLAPRKKRWCGTRYAGRTVGQERSLAFRAKEEHGRAPELSPDGKRLLGLSHCPDE